ncbi:MAG: hypothetical protein ABF633_07685 [Clostridium sp.]|uniref:hypothetical protein n=1 Tax=Clostridium sp. TaxID=1506 RepID=UPI0039E9BA39
MNKKHYKLIRFNKAIVVALIVIITLTIWSISSNTINLQKNFIQAGTKEIINKKSNTVSVYYNITFGDKIKNADPDIINAAVQGIFDYYCTEHNNVINKMNTYVLIMDVKKLLWKMSGKLTLLQRKKKMILILQLDIVLLL